jgi:predicted O-methyltransferase YrrM
MDAGSSLLSVDNDEAVVSVARRHLARDHRVTFAVADGASYLAVLLAEGRTFDLIFADAWPGKYTNLEQALELIRAGGIYIVDDLLPQPNWPEDHPAKVSSLIATLASRPDFHVTCMNWSTGIAIAAKVR